MNLQLHVHKRSQQVQKWKFKFLISSVIQQSIPAISTMILTALVSSYSVSAIAAFGVIGKVESILLYPAMAINMGLTTIVGQCIGAGRTDRMNDYVKTALKYGFLFLALLTLLVVVFSKNLSWLFVKSDSVGMIVKQYYIIAGAGYVIYGLKFYCRIKRNGKNLSINVFMYILFLMYTHSTSLYIIKFFRLRVRRDLGCCNG